MPTRRHWVACSLALLFCASCTPLSRQPPAPYGAELALNGADTVRVTRVRDHVRYLYAWDRTGPWAIHVLEVARACAPIWQARRSGSSLADRATTSALSFGALAAINGDFFALPLGTPVGAQVRGSEVLIGPADRPVAVGFAADGQAIDAARLDARLLGRRLSAPINQINRVRPPDAPSGVRLFTSWFGSGAPRDSTVFSTRVRLVAPNRGIVELIDSAGNAIWLDSANVVLHIPPATPIALGDTLRWTAQIRLPAMTRPVTELLGGFPLLLRSGRNVLAEQQGVRPDFGERRHPRTAIGFTFSGTALLVVVDGRRPGYSDGMTLQELTELMSRLGALDALNLDGGGSSALVVRGRVMNRPSDREGERAVGNALALVRCR